MADTVSWGAPECPFVVEYAARALDNIRLAISDAFYSLPRGGAEIGGLLLGKWEAGLLTISGYKPLECEHAFGPSFTLSPRDCANLAELISLEQGSGAHVAGWYHSHTRSEIFLSEADLKIHAEFFPAAWQVALVLRPHTLRPTRAGFFFRDTGGAIRAESSYKEFALHPLAPAPVAVAAPGISSSNEAPANSASRPAPAAPAISRANELPIDALPSSTQPALSAAAPDRGSERLPRFLEAKPATIRLWPKIVIPLAVGAAIGAPAYWKRDLWLPSGIATMRTSPAAPVPAALGLNTLDIDGQLLIRWNASLRDVFEAQRGVLRITGAAPFPEEIALDREHLLSGVFTIARQSERVDVSLTLNRPNGRPVRETTAFLGKLPDAMETDAASQTEQDALAGQVSDIKAQLDEEIKRNRKLEDSLDLLAKKLRYRQGARRVHPAASK